MARKIKSNPLGWQAIEFVNWKILLIGILLNSVSLESSSQGDVSKSRWISSAIVVDGNDHEWEKPLNFYDDKTGLFFAIGNDNKNLYLCFTGNDEMKMKKLMSAGWTISLSSKEKKNRFKAELIFHGVNMMGFKKSENKLERKAAADNQLKIYQMQLKSVVTKGFRSNVNEVMLNNDNGIGIGIGLNNTQHVVYEMAIPLSELSIADLDHSPKMMTMNVTVNAIERPTSGAGFAGGRSGMGGGRAGGMSGGMGGGRRGGSMGGGMGGGFGGGMSPRGENRGGSSLSEKQSFKQKFTLTVNSDQH